MGIVCAVVPVTGYCSEWYMQEFDNDDGTLDAINLYDDNGNFVQEFRDLADLYSYIRAVTHTVWPAGEG